MNEYHLLLEAPDALASQKARKLAPQMIAWNTALVAVWVYLALGEFRGRSKPTRIRRIWCNSHCRHASLSQLRKSVRDIPRGTHAFTANAYVLSCVRTVFSTVAACDTLGLFPCQNRLRLHCYS